MLTGVRASAIVAPAPTTCMPARSMLACVSKNASLPQSSTWLPAMEITSKPASANASAPSGRASTACRACGARTPERAKLVSS
jgi:hypothetical protein